VLIEGESGVGKELIARAIHGSGARRSKPFVAVNCGAIPDNLVESTLFGHERGAFTGATERHVGKFVEASGGTLFLDEIGELPLAAQVKLLRAIQEGEVDSVGGKKPLQIDVRLISASNRSLLTAVKEGRFREDLFYRLHVFPIWVPPLRERPEDISDLVRHFLARFNAEEGKRIRAVSAAAMSLLNAYPWPGNVRQLENAVFRAVVLAEADEIGIAEFPQIAAPAERPEPMAATAAPLLLEAPAAEPIPAVDRIDPASLSPGLSPEAGPGMLPILDAKGDIRPLAEVESELIRLAIAHYDGQMSEVARKLRIGRSTLYRRLKELGLETDELREFSSGGVAAE
jgi:DNA-binding NtrC family response regulator